MKTFTTFKELLLPLPLYGALEKMNFHTPTPVQAASLTPALEGKDVLGSAQTGTGKTAAFAIPLLAKLYSKPGSKALILAPTRELAAQIHRVLQEMSEGMRLKGALLVGGESFYQQKCEVKAGADYFVCTPGRLIDHLDAGFRFPSVCMLVLDEVDRMLDMGFAPQLKQIVPHVPKERQTLFFSATLPKEILVVAANYLKNPVRISIGATSQPIDNVKQENYATTHLNKNELLLKHLANIKGRVLIFARTKHRTDRVFLIVERNKFPVVRLHGGRTQGQRKSALGGFRSGTHLIMVATDLAGRGIDVDDIECVINYDVPASREDYIHRIGRTARNGKTGRALNYLTPQDHEGKGIISVPQSKAGPAQPTAPLHPNKPGWQKGGWSQTGGRNRPEFQKRTPAERYGNNSNSSRKSFGVRPRDPRPHFAKGLRPSFDGHKRGDGEKNAGTAFTSPDGRRPFGEKNHPPRFDRRESNPSKMSFFRASRGEKFPPIVREGKRGPRPPFGAKRRRQFDVPGPGGAKQRSFGKPSFK